MRMFVRSLAAVLVWSLAGPIFAASDPSMDQIYETAQSGDLTKAQQMIKEVLRDHPASAKAHYVAAELYARAGDLSKARQELNFAKTLEPRLSFAKPDSVRALQQELSQAQSPSKPSSAVPRSFPWSPVLGVVAVIVLWFMTRTRSAPTDVYSPPSTNPAVSPAPPASTGVAPGAGGGIGSGIAGSVVSGLAVGAGVVAGEDLARRFFDGEPRPSDPLPPSNDAFDSPVNGNLGGADFGVTDPSTWDDEVAAPDSDGDGSDNGDWN